MNRLPLFVSLLFISLALPAREPARGQPVDGYAAEVDGRIITVRDVIEETREQMNEVMQNPEGSREELLRKQEAVFNEGLSRLVDRKLMIAKFEKMGATLPVGTIRDRKERILRDRYLGRETTGIV